MTKRGRTNVPNSHSWFWWPHCNDIQYTCSTARYIKSSRKWCAHILYVVCYCNFMNLTRYERHSVFISVDFIMLVNCWFLFFIFRAGRLKKKTHSLKLLKSWCSTITNCPLESSTVLQTLRGPDVVASYLRPTRITQCTTKAMETYINLFNCQLQAKVFKPTGEPHFWNTIFGTDELFKAFSDFYWSANWRRGTW